MHELHATLLALLFAAGKPLTLEDFAKLGHPEDILLRSLESLAAKLSSGDTGVGLEYVARGWRLVVHPRHLVAVEQVLRPTPPKLSKAALEVLAIVAYHQPLTRAEIEALRGKSAEGVLDGLVERELVRVVGEKDAVGKPKLYGTTERFLITFGLQSLDDLPAMEEGPTLLLRS